MITAWISNQKSSDAWSEITYLFPNFNGATVEVWEWKSNFIPHIIIDVITYNHPDNTLVYLILPWSDKTLYHVYLFIIAFIVS